MAEAQDAGMSLNEINHDLLQTLSFPSLPFFFILFLLSLGILFGLVGWGYQIGTGMGVAGYRPSVMWGAYLANFLFWIGIAHSGTFISSILYLHRAEWRTAISRTTETMTIFAIVNAGLMPIVHLGRSWIFYWLFPYPNQRQIWPDFDSPLMFDFYAILTYLLVSLLFWYTGMVPDLAVVRDRVKGIRRKIYGYFSLGWSGADRQWRHYSESYLLFAALAAGLVISVESTVAWDFSLIILPGYHSTFAPPSFLATAIQSGLAMALVLLVPVRRVFRLEHIITARALENTAKALVFMSLIFGYSYLMDMFTGWYSGDIFERQRIIFALTSWYSPLFYIFSLIGIILPIFFFIKRLRTSATALFVIPILVLCALWWERFHFVIQPMSRSYLPYSWGYYWPTWVEWSVVIMTFCQFFMMLLLFFKFVPFVPIADTKGRMKPKRPDGDI